MAQISVLVLVHEVEQALRIVRVCEREFLPVVANSPEEVPALISHQDFWVMVVDSTYAAYDRWKDLINKDISVIIIGQDEAEVYQMLLSWPQEYYLDYILERNGQPFEPILSLLLQRAVNVSRIKKSGLNSSNHFPCRPEILRKFSGRSLK